MDKKSSSFVTRMLDNRNYIAEIERYYPTLEMWTSLILVTNEDYS
jgi:hypothetical protein